MKYSNAELCAMVDEFRAFAAEPSWLEFKTGMKDPVQIAKYISGLSNVAAYAGNTHGYLVWGVDDDRPGRLLRVCCDDAGRWFELVGLVFDGERVLVIHAMRLRRSTVEQVRRAQ